MNIDSEPVINDVGDKRWYKDGLLHRDEVDVNGETLPAIEYVDGTREWYQHGLLHRDELDSNGQPLPALIWSGYREWLQRGELHRVDGPAIVDEKGVVGVLDWWLYGENHREQVGDIENSPAREFSNGTKVWFHHGKHHRDPVEGGYSVIDYNNKRWHQHGELIRSE